MENETFSLFKRKLEIWISPTQMSISSSVKVIAPHFMYSTELIYRKSAVRVKNVALNIVAHLRVAHGRKLNCNLLLLKIRKKI